MSREQDFLAALMRSDAKLEAIAAKLPPCPTCGGKNYLPMLTDIGPNPLDYKCPDCVDGKVSIEQLVATYNAVHGPGPWDDPMYHDGYCEIGCVERLRSVKP
jgi:hypothetical protein